jgi:hypothetical protein
MRVRELERWRSNGKFRCGAGLLGFGVLARRSAFGFAAGPRSGARLP